MSANKGRIAGEKRIRSYIFVFLLPAFLIYTIFMIIPLIASMGVSFYTPDDNGNEVFSGFSNYVKLLTDDYWAPRFWGALKNNFLFFFVHLLLQNPIGLLLATLLTSSKIKGAPFFRTIFFMPTTLSIVIVGFVWQLILSPSWGIAEGFMNAVGLGAFFKPWLGLERYALVVLSGISVWQFIGIPMMLFYTALIGIPDSLTEAARVDGASGWISFWRIKVPLILPTAGIVTVLTFVGNFNAFDLIYTTQKVAAGPEFSTDIFGTFFFRTYFGYQLQPGNPTMGATIAAMMFLIILSGVLVYMFGWRNRQESYQL